MRLSGSGRHSINALCTAFIYLPVRNSSRSVPGVHRKNADLSIKPTRREKALHGGLSERLALLYYIGIILSSVMNCVIHIFLRYAGYFFNPALNLRFYNRIKQVSFLIRIARIVSRSPAIKPNPTGLLTDRILPFAVLPCQPCLFLYCLRSFERFSALCSVHNSRFAI